MISIQFSEQMNTSQGHSLLPWSRGGKALQGAGRFQNDTIDLYKLLVWPCSITDEASGKYKHISTKDKRTWEPKKIRKTVPQYSWQYLLLIFSDNIFQWVKRVLQVTLTFRSTISDSTVHLSFPFQAFTSCQNTKILQVWTTLIYSHKDGSQKHNSAWNKHNIEWYVQQVPFMKI